MEKIEVLNQRLIDYFGIDTASNKPIFRIVFANDQTEMVLTTTTENGVELLHPMVMEMKKYSYLKDMYVLERLVVVPDVNLGDIPAEKLSYEPIWGYGDEDHRPQYPIWKATKFIIDTLLAAQGVRSLRKYVEDEKFTTPEGKEQRVTELQRELFGNETETADALRYKEGIVVPRTYSPNQKET